MKARSTPWMGAALSLTAALALALGAPGAFAATPNTTAPAATGTLPPAQHAGSVSYLSGGIGSDQSAAFKAAMTRYPLSLEFARHSSAGGNEYLSNVPVKISDAHGQHILSTRTNGPFMLLTLPNGHYIVTASHGGKTVNRTVDIGKTSHAHEAFVWPM